MAAVERALLSAWDHKRYRVRHIATYSSHHGPSLVKACRAIVALWRVAWGMATWRPHIVHVHISQGGSLYRKTVVLILAKTFGVRAILLHAHASNFHLLYEESGRLRRAWIRSLLQAAERLIVLGSWWRDYYASLRLSIPIDVLPNAIVCPAEITPYGQRPLVVLTLGELGERKGTYDTLRAIPAVLRRHPRAEFWLAGDGDVAAVQAMIDKESWGKQVKLLGWVEGQAKLDALAKARVFLLPSYQEGLPVAVLEAMAHGVPVITTPVGDIPDAVTDGETGFLIAPGDVESIVDRVSLLLGDALLAERIGARARSHAYQTYDVHAIIPRLFTIYDLAANRPPT